MRYRLAEHLIQLKEDESFSENDVRIEIVTREEMVNCEEQLPHKKALLHMLLHIQYCRAEVFGPCVVGTLVILNRKNLPARKAEIGFYMTDRRLLLIEDGDFAKSIIGRLKENDYRETHSAAVLMADFLNLVIENDAAFLQEIESGLIVLEEELLKEQSFSSKEQKKLYSVILKYRKDMLHMHSCFSQMQDLGDVFCSNINHLLNEEELRLFSAYSGHVNRLVSHTRMLREYVLQIHDMYQTQMDLIQNHTMSLLTVVTTIFLPLTLLVGWYGMNFVHMPELHWEHGYLWAIVLSIVMILVEVYIFKKKHLL